jgi:hypothetical protein
MKEIKKSASFKSKQKGKDVQFNIDLNYSPEYDSFIIKIKEGEGFMSYTSSIERMPLEVIQKLNEMLEEVLIKAGSQTEMSEDLEVELGAEPNPNHSLKSHTGSVKIKTHRVKVKSLSEAQNKVREFIEENDLGSGNFTGGDLFSHGKKIGRVSYNGRLWDLKDEPMKMFDGGDFQAGVYNKGGALTNERLHVNKGEDYEVRYAKPRPKRKGYKGLRSFDDGGNIDLTDDKRLRLRKPAMPKRKLTEAEWMAKHNDSKEARTYGFGGLFSKSAIMSRPKPIDLNQQQVRLKSGEYVQVLNQQGDTLMVMDLSKLGTGTPPKYVKLSDVDMTSLANGGGVGLIGNQKRIDMNKNGKIDAEDFKLLRSSMNGAWRNERKHVNHNEDYEVRYAKKKPSRTGYKGKRKFGEGGGISTAERFKKVVAKNREANRVKPMSQKMSSGAEVKKANRGGVMVLAKKIRKDGESWKDALKRAGQQLK